MIKAIENSGAYYMGLANLDDSGSVITMKFDTGAINTIISLNALVSTNIDKERFLAEICNKTQKKLFRSASGNEMQGFLICAKNVLLSGTPIEQFFYYLIVDIEENIGLIGNDFISKCRFHHEVDDDIEITFFHQKRYQDDTKQAITNDEVNAILQLCSL
ncbi:MAG: hypothetical protein IJR00_11830 [Lachnospiraceae bacterium]|nr:hypothetical protein [Lachnospiraceae bacterium]